MTSKTIALKVLDGIRRWLRKPRQGVKQLHALVALLHRYLKKRQTALFLRAAIALCNKLIEFVRLLIDAVGYPLFALAAGRRRRLLDKLPKVVSQDSNAIVEFRKR